MTKASENEYPKITVAESAAPGTPTAGLGYVYQGVDKKLYLVDDTGAATDLSAAAGAVSTDAIWDAKGDLAIGTAANTAARLAVGTDAYVLTADSTAALGIKWAAAGGNVAADAIWDAKGDIAVGTASNAAARLAVGTNDYVLTADSTAATGLKWAAAANDHKVSVTSDDASPNYLSTKILAGSGITVTIGTAVGDPVYGPLILAETYLVAYYRMDEASGTALNDSKGTNDGTIAGSPTYEATGALTDDANTAMSLGGDFGTSKVTGTGSTLPTGTTFTLEAWVNGCTANGQICGWGDGGTSGQKRQLSRFNNHIYFWGETQDVDTGVDFSAGWNHIVVSCDAGTITVYKNKSVIAGPTAKTLATCNQNIHITDSSMGLGTTSCTLDEFAIYSAALDATAVGEHYDAGHDSPPGSSETLTIAVA